MVLYTSPYLLCCPCWLIACVYVTPPCDAIHIAPNGCTLLQAECVCISDASSRCCLHVPNCAVLLLCVCVCVCVITPHRGNAGCVGKASPVLWWTKVAGTKTGMAIATLMRAASRATALLRRALTGVPMIQILRLNKRINSIQVRLFPSPVTQVKIV